MVATEKSRIDDGSGTAVVEKAKPTEAPEVEILYRSVVAKVDVSIPKILPLLVKPNRFPLGPKAKSRSGPDPELTEKVPRLVKTPEVRFSVPIKCDPSVVLFVAYAIPDGLIANVRRLKSPAGRPEIFATKDAAPVVLLTIYNPLLLEPLPLTAYRFPLTGLKSSERKFQLNPVFPTTVPDPVNASMRNNLSELASLNPSMEYRNPSDP